MASLLPCHTHHLMPAAHACGATLPRLAALTCLRGFSHAPAEVEICVVDPRLVLEPQSAVRSADEDPTKLSSLCLRVPRAFQPHLLRGTFALGDADSPESSWTFGRGGELFELHFEGSLRVPSGFASIIETGVLHGRSRESYGSWEGLKQRLADDSTALPTSDYPFLFAGRILEAASASVFVKRGQGGVEGLVISSEVEEVD